MRLVKRLLVNTRDSAEPIHPRFSSALKSDFTHPLQAYETLDRRKCINIFVVPVSRWRSESWRSGRPDWNIKSGNRIRLRPRRFSHFGFSRSISWRRVHGKSSDARRPPRRNQYGDVTSGVEALVLGHRRLQRERHLASTFRGSTSSSPPGRHGRLQDRPHAVCFFIGSPQNGRHRVRGIPTLLRKTSAASQGTALQLHVSNPFYFSYLKTRIFVSGILGCSSRFEYIIPLRGHSNRASMTSLFFFWGNRRVSMSIFLFFIFYTVKYGFLDETFFGTMTDFETTFDVKGHLEWGLRYRRCDRVSGCWL